MSHALTTAMHNATHYYLFHNLTGLKLETKKIETEVELSGWNESSS